MLSSLQLRGALVAALGAVALAAAFPKVGAAWLVPFGVAALFWTWQDASWKRAAVLGWFAGMIFFSIDYAWVGNALGSYIGKYAAILPVGAAFIVAPSFGIAGALASIAYTRVRPGVAPLAAAAIFTFCEWIRSIGVLGAPFDQLGYTQAGTPLRAIAAFAGTYGITFVLCVLGAYLADAIHRRTWRPLALACAAVILVTAASWLAWPARHLPAPTIPVAAIQGNIAQSIKWKDNLDLAVERYTSMTRQAMHSHPALIVWPETVITTTLNYDPELVREFEQLAREANATIVAGSLDQRGRRLYNTLYLFDPHRPTAIYAKRQLVPFVESFPGKPFLSWLPYVGALNGGLTSGTADGVYPTTALPIAPLICWESAFADLAHAQTRNGAQLLVISTDDAWFGTTAGPFMHAQIAQLRAIESGTYVVRAAATGISGIIAPDGTWLARSGIERRQIVIANVGPPAPTFFAWLGPTPVALAMLLLYLGAFLLRRRGDDAVA
jgi:apolipoprotein N-acyltransferase